MVPISISIEMNKISHYWDFIEAKLKGNSYLISLMIWLHANRTSVVCGVVGMIREICLCAQGINGSSSYRNNIPDILKIVGSCSYYFGHLMMVEISGR